MGVCFSWGNMASYLVGMEMVTMGLKAMVNTAMMRRLNWVKVQQ